MSTKFENTSLSAHTIPHHNYKAGFKYLLLSKSKGPLLSKQALAGKYFNQDRGLQYLDEK